MRGMNKNNKLYVIAAVFSFPLAMAEFHRAA